MTFFEKILELPLFREVKKIASFGAIGVINALVDYGVFYLLVLLVLIPNGVAGDTVPTALVNVCAWAVAVTGSYIMNSKLTFKAHTGGELSFKKYGEFALAGVVAMIVNTSVLLIAKSFMPLLLAKLVAVGVSFVVSFAVTRFYVFGDKK
jgi:putative flippase GtrA